MLVAGPPVEHPRVERVRSTGATMTARKLCGNDIESGALCSRCPTALALTPGEPVRRPSPRAKCNHPELMRALVRELTADGGDYATRSTVPMAVTYGTAVTRSFWSGVIDGTSGADERRAYGVLEM